MVGFISSEHTIVTMNDKCYINYVILAELCPGSGGPLSWRTAIVKWRQMWSQHYVTMLQCYSILGICFLCPLSVNRLLQRHLIPSVEFYLYPTVIIALIHLMWVGLLNVSTSLLVPQNSSVTLETEFAHLLDWSQKINLNTSKTKEIVYHRPRLSRHIIAPSITWYWASDFW